MANQRGETTSIGHFYNRCIDAVNNLFDTMSFWTHSKDVEFVDGKTAETKVGAINGITSDMSGEADDIAASIKCVNQLNSSLTFPDGTIFYADIKDGKPGFNTDSGRGADTFFPFSSGGGSFVADWISCKIINALTYYAPNTYNSNMCSLSETDLIINKSGTLEVDSGVLAQNSNETKFNLYINDVVKISHSNKGSYSNNVFSEQLQVEAGDVIKVQMKSGKSGVEGGAIFVCLHFIE